ncbi:hypothetical protein LCGC14_2402390 [marine sediment metagenome]|uniref:Uncharacterized protein n=1 Tax=marine sediment metagenome TaxID=412755 RepID=A0A0F9BUZ1_9ZZZZ
MKPTIHFAIQTATGAVARGTKIEIRRCSIEDEAEQLLYTFTVTDLTWSLPFPGKRGQITAVGEAIVEAEPQTIRHTMYHDLMVTIPDQAGETILPVISLEHLPLERPAVLDGAGRIQV